MTSTHAIDGDVEVAPDSGDAAATMLDRSNGNWWRSRATAAVLLPPLWFLVLRPESFGLTPNRLDPFFYTGYAINFDDIMVAIDDQRYFVTRWTVYLPSRFMSEIFGPVWGRLGLRWALASIVLLALWHLGRQWRWTRPAETVVGVVVITMPMFMRAFLTDYVEWMFVSVLLLMVMQCLEPRRRWWRPPLIGALAAVAVIANPFAAVVCVAPFIAYLVRSARTPSRAAIDVAAAVLGGTAVVTVGLIAFRWRYGIEDVYAPTLQYLGSRSGGPDPWKSPRLDWLLAYSWIYVPAVALAVGWIPSAIRRRLLATTGGLAASLVLAAQYVGQWLDQFVRNGNGIEISYYWVFVYPSLAVYLALLIGLFAWRWAHAAFFLTGWFVVLLVARVFDPGLPGSWAFPIVLVATVGVLVVAAMRRPAWSVAALLIAVLALQVNAPNYDPAAYTDVNSDPRYDEIAFHPQTRSVQAFHEALWFEERLDTLPDDSDLFFLPHPGFASAIVGIYGPHVTGHLLGLAGDDLSERTQTSVERGLVSRVAVYGPPAFVDRAVAALDPHITGELLTDQNAEGLGFVVSVVEVRSPGTGRFTWSAAALPSATGREIGGARVVQASRDDAGYLLFGPYVRLSDRRYRATIEYRSDRGPDATIGRFEASRNEVTEDGLVDLGPVGAVDLVGSSGRVATASFEFDGTAVHSWEMRVLWNGAGKLTVEEITVEPIE